MPPKKNKKRNQDQDDKQFLKRQKNVQQILKKITKNNKKQVTKNNEDQQDQNQSVFINKKQAFNYDFSNQKALIQHQQKQAKLFRQKQEKQKQAKQLTPQQKIQLQKKLQKQRIQKQKKQRKKQQKRAQRLKQLQQQKIKEQQIKQQEEKQNEEVRKKLNETKGSGKGLPIFLLILFILLCALQYQKQIYSRLSKFKLDGQENYYQIFQIDSAATDKQLKEKYKRLVLKYHPDKNPNCKDCQQKFNKIIVAWQVLGNPAKRKNYDSNSGFITQIKSQSITLNPQIYNEIYNSNSLWIIQVYDSTQKYCHYFSQFWQDIVKEYNKFIKFGRIDTWTQSQMLSYMPYNFQVFPSIYFVHKGQVGLCQFDFQRPQMSVRRCIQSQYKQNLLIQVNKIEQIVLQQKPSIIFNPRIKIGSKFKIINKKYENNFKFYSLKTNNQNQNDQIITLLNDGSKRVFNLNQKDVEYYSKYQKFLQSLIIQKVSICELIQLCQNQQCFILTNSLISLKDIKLPQQKIQNLRPFYIIQEYEQLQKAIQKYKNKTQQNYQNFNLGLYQNGHIDLGYLDQFQYLNIEQGESFNQLKCVYKDNSLSGRLIFAFKSLFSSKERQQQ